MARLVTPRGARSRAAPAWALRPHLAWILSVPGMLSEPGFGAPVVSGPSLLPFWAGAGALVLSAAVGVFSAHVLLHSPCPPPPPPIPSEDVGRELPSAARCLGSSV